ncbi:MAG: class I SAM-dependent methyltransferase [Pseudomonadota bacterium]
MNNGWDESADAWIAKMGEHGDWGRETILDPAMLARLARRRFERALDVGCGEGRFCRVLQRMNIATVGIDLTAQLVERAKLLDPDGGYQVANAEQLPFADASFDLVVNYLALLDIDGYRTAIQEMARVLKPSGTVLIANLTSFNTAGASIGWIKDEQGRRLHYPIDRYLNEFSYWDAWAGIRVKQWHRPLRAYFSALSESGLQMTFFDEPEPQSGEPERVARYRRAPWFLVMEWRKPDAPG